MKTLLEIILKTIEPLMIKIIDDYKNYYREELEREMTDFDIKMTRLQLTYKMLSSIEIYTADNDILVKLNARPSKGSIVIDAIIEREGVKYNFTTEVIYAGGYNIQKLHIRYITNTNLPKTNKTTEANEIAEKIKKLNKIERIKEDIRRTELQISNQQKNIEDSKKLTDDEILEKSGSFWLQFRNIDWNEIVRRGADKNYDYSQEKFEASKQEYRNDLIVSFRRSIIIGENTITELKNILKNKITN